MVYTQKNPALLIIGVIMLTIWSAAETNLLTLFIEHLHLKRYKYSDEIKSLSLIFGIFSIIVGLWQLLANHKQGSLDYYASAIAGTMFILLITMVIRWFLAPEVASLSTRLGPVAGTGKPLHKLLGLNYIVLGIVTGIIITNLFKLPAWIENGLHMSRLCLKTGVILLGALFSAAELKHLGALSLILVSFFILGSVGMVLWLGAKMKISNSMGGVLSAGMGVCGVSATVAAAPVVQAKSVEIAYTIATVLLWGIICMFLFPIIGHYLGMSYVQFGAWAGTGILNSAQVAGAALAFQPHGIETLKVAEIFNITRVLMLPTILLWLSVWYVRREETTDDKDINIKDHFFAKFPIFVIGFILMFYLSSLGLFAPANHYKGKYFDNTKVSPKKMLTAAEVKILTSIVDKISPEQQKKALTNLINNKKIMSAKDDLSLRGLRRAIKLNKINGIDTKSARLVSKILKKSYRAVRHRSKKIKTMRNWIVWLFAFGLVGLGLQITVKSMKQAGGIPLLIGTVIGLAKASISLFVILKFINA